MNDEDMASEAPLFISRKRRRIGSRGVQHDLEKWVRLAGLEGRYSPHALRHTVGFELIRGTNNIRKVQEFLGHADPRMTSRYAHVVDMPKRNPALRIPVKVGSGALEPK